YIWFGLEIAESVNEIVMESKYGKKKSSSSSSSLFYEAPLGYSIEDVRPNGGIKKFKSLSTPTSISAWFPNPIVLSFYYKFKQQGDIFICNRFRSYEKPLEVSFFEPSIFQDSKGLGLRT
ncbi:unnamed protein product, partial [Brassica oleracea var. botrytis]